MKYFAKYLPVEGEIKIGDTYTTQNWINNNKSPVQRTQEGDYTNKIKLSLYLCSKDIKVGDKITITKNMFCVKEGDYIADKLLVKVLEENPLSLSKHVFKVIGLISPEAIWVKEGDEFDKEDVNILESTLLWSQDKVDECSSLTYNTKRVRYRTFIERIFPSEFWADKKETYIEIKCPTCKTFH